MSKLDCYLLCIFVGGILGILIHAYVTGTLFVK
jgi:hypothetical protein